MFSFYISCWGLCEITQPYPSCEDKKHAQTHLNPPLARSWSHWPPGIWGNQLLTRSNSGDSAFFWHQWSIIGYQFISSAISTKKYNRNPGSKCWGSKRVLAPGRVPFTFMKSFLQGTFPSFKARLGLCKSRCTRLKKSKKTIRVQTLHQWMWTWLCLQCTQTRKIYLLLWKNCKRMFEGSWILKVNTPYFELIE